VCAAQPKARHICFSSALNPAFSPPSSLRFDAIAPKPKAKADRRRRIIRRLGGNTSDGIGRTIIQ
jgi:hypothetical protein